MRVTPITCPKCNGTGKVGCCAEHRCSGERRCCRCEGAGKVLIDADRKYKQELEELMRAAKLIEQGNDPKEGLENV